MDVWQSPHPCLYQYETNGYIGVQFILWGTMSISCWIASVSITIVVDFVLCWPEFSELEWSNPHPQKLFSLYSGLFLEHASCSHN